MEFYKVSKSPDPDIWLALDEESRIDLVYEYVIEHEPDVDSGAKMIHANTHVVVENQLAMGEKPTVDAYARLKRQGLSRHNIIHAIGAVIIEDVYSLLKGEANEKTIQYKNRLRKLTAKRWLKGQY